MGTCDIEVGKIRAVRFMRIVITFAYWRMRLCYGRLKEGCWTEWMGFVTDWCKGFCARKFHMTKDSIEDSELSNRVNIRISL